MSPYQSHLSGDAGAGREAWALTTSEGVEGFVAVNAVNVHLMLTTTLLETNIFALRIGGFATILSFLGPPKGLFSRAKMYEHVIFFFLREVFTFWVPGNNNFQGRGDNLSEWGTSGVIVDLKAAWASEHQG